ncbi:MAG TPA: hypothetical protein VFP77_05645, partial [Gemmatimonadaceae bacterium]|nr:hypothetical protein [Gemmatimonadaceae bacterium]
MSEATPRVVGVLVGDIVNEPGARTKYGFLFDALARRLPVVDVHDVTLRGMPRWINALRTVHPDPHRWRERFYKNVPAFQSRSRHAAAFLR